MACRFTALERPNAESPGTVVPAVQLRLAHPEEFPAWKELMNQLGSYRDLLALCCAGNIERSEDSWLAR